MLLSLPQFKQLLAILFPLDLILILKDKDDFFFTQPYFMEEKE